MLMFSLYCRCNFIAEDGHVTETFLINMKILTVLFVLKFLVNLRVKTIPDLITYLFHRYEIVIILLNEIQ